MDVAGGAGSRTWRTRFRAVGRSLNRSSTTTGDRLRYFDRARRFTSYLAVDASDGCTYLLPTGDRGVARDLFAKGFRPETFILGRVAAVVGRPVAPRTTFVDVGANIGTSVIPAVQAYGYGRGVAIEPFPANARALRLNCAANGVHDLVQVVEAAASDVEGIAELDIGAPGWGVHRLRRGDGAVQTAPVTVVSLDGLVERGVLDPESVGLVWVDVQGHEGHVLNGARRLLEQAPPLAVALRPKKLAREHGTEAFVDALQRAYTHVIDLRGPGLRAPTWEPEPLSVEQLPALVAARRKTDILVLNLSR